MPMHLLNVPRSQWFPIRFLDLVASEGISMIRFDKSDRTDHVQLFLNQRTTTTNNIQQYKYKIEKIKNILLYSVIIVPRGLRALSQN